MRIALISDIHANITALESVLREIDDLTPAVDEIVCLGDIVGYGAEPGECIDLISRRCSTVVAGNHDRAICQRLDAERFNALAKNAIDWTRDQLSDDHVEYLTNLPMQAQIGDLLLVHASPAAEGDFPYIRDPLAAAAAFLTREFRYAAFGHTHLPVTFYFDGRSVRTTLSPTVDLAPAGSFLFNVGSVGQPRDQDPRACYVIYDQVEQRLTWQRVDYDLEDASTRIVRAGLPEQLGRRLLVGV